MAASIAELIAALSSADAAARCEAAEGLARHGEEAGPAAAALARAAGDEDETVREAAVWALEELGPPPLDQLDQLAGLLSSAEADTAYWAATLLGRLEDHAAAAVPALSQALAPSVALPVRERAAWALGKIGPSAAAAREALTAAAGADEPRLSRLAQKALGGIG